MTKGQGRFIPTPCYAEPVYGRVKTRDAVSLVFPIIKGSMSSRSNCCRLRYQQDTFRHNIGINRFKMKKNINKSNSQMTF